MSEQKKPEMKSKTPANEEMLVDMKSKTPANKEMLVEMKSKIEAIQKGGDSDETTENKVKEQIETLELMEQKIKAKAILEETLTKKEQRKKEALEAYKHSLALEAQKIKDDEIATAEGKFRQAIQRIKSMTAIDKIELGCTLVFTHNYKKPFSLDGFNLEMGETSILVDSTNIKKLNIILDSRMYNEDPNISHEIK